MIKSIEAVKSIFFFLFFYTSRGENAISTFYKAELHLDNKFLQNDFLSDNPARSVAACSAMCFESRHRCGCFGFQPREKKCRLHESCTTMQSAEYAGDWLYYCPDSMYLHVFHRVFFLQCCVFMYLANGEDNEN
jgi:hypothetical protein